MYVFVHTYEQFSVSCVCLCSYLTQLESAGRMLKVTEARLEDSGRYTCLATNAAGEAQQHIRLSVHGNLKKHTALSVSCVSVHCLAHLLVSVIYIILSVFCVEGLGGDRRVSSDKLLFLCVILCVSLRASQYPPLWRDHQPDHPVRLSH